MAGSWQLQQRMSLGQRTPEGEPYRATRQAGLLPHPASPAQRQAHLRGPACGSAAPLQTAAPRAPGRWSARVCGDGRRAALQVAVHAALDGDGSPTTANIPGRPAPPAARRHRPTPFGTAAVPGCTGCPAQTCGPPPPASLASPCHRQAIAGRRRRERPGGWRSTGTSDVQAAAGGGGGGRRAAGGCRHSRGGRAAGARLVRHAGQPKRAQRRGLGAQSDVISSRGLPAVGQQPDRDLKCAGDYESCSCSSPHQRAQQA